MSFEELPQHSAHIEVTDVAAMLPLPDFSTKPGSTNSLVLSSVRASPWCAGTLVEEFRHHSVHIDVTDVAAVLPLLGGSLPTI